MKKILLLFFACFVFMAPAYVNQNSALRLDPGNCQTLYNLEQPLTGTFSQQVSVPPEASSKAQPINLSFELTWASNPGAFNIQIQDADTDVTGNYVTLNSAGTITSSPITPGGAYVSRVELVPWAGNFGRLYVNTQSANAVNLTAKVCRR